MGTFTTSVEIGDPGARRWEAVDVLVDSGATFTMLPRSLLEHLGVRPQDKVPFELADGRSIEYDVGETAVRIGNRVRTTLVVFGDNGLQPLLGAYTLEAFLLAVDTVNRRLVPVSGLLERSGQKIVSLRASFTSSLRKAISVLEVANSVPPKPPPESGSPFSIIERLNAELFQPLPEFRSAEGRFDSRQRDIFALYGLRSAARGYLIGLRHHQAGLLTQAHDFLAAGVFHHYIATYHALSGLLGLRGYVLVRFVIAEPVTRRRKRPDVVITFPESPPLDGRPGIVLGKLKKDGSWDFEPRPLSHSGVWGLLPEVKARPGNDLPDGLLNWIKDRDDSGDGAFVAQTPAEARHQAIYEGYGYDDVAHDQALNGDLGAGHALDYKVRGLCSLSDNMLRQLLREIDDNSEYLVGPHMKFVCSTWALGVMTPPFEMPDREDWTHEDAARAARLGERLGARSNS